MIPFIACVPSNFSSIRVRLSLLLALLGCLFPTAARAQAPQVLHKHVRPVVASGKAVVVGSLPPTRRLNLAIMLPPRNQPELTGLLARLYDPSSPDYRHFLSVGQFTEQFGPTKEDYQAVVDFATSNGFSVANQPSNRLLVDVNGTVAQIEQSFHVAMKVYQHPTEDRTFYSLDREPSLNLNVPIAGIEGLDDFSIPHPKLVRSQMDKANNSHTTGSGPGGQFLGSDMRAAYYGGSALRGSGQSVGLFELDGYDPNHVTATFDGEANSVPINNVLVDGASAGSDGDDSEQVLDIVQAASMAPGLDQVLVYIAPGSDWAAGVVEVDTFNKMATDNIAKQLSCSWGWNPNDEKALDPIFQEFAVQGQNLFDATGDNGALTGNNAADNYLWPGDDVYLTAVGGTDLTTNGAGGAWVSETAWKSSNGGRSDNGILIPDWQVGVASPAADASTTLRNVPDVAAEGNNDNYLCADSQGSYFCAGGWGGTSFAAPRWAGFLALVNQQAVASGYTSVGFINPALYMIGQGSSYDSDFHDITSGDNDCCGQSTYWTAVPGYDLVTGWGSPSGQNMIDALVGYSVSITSASSATFTTGVTGSFAVTTTGFPTPALNETGPLPSAVQFTDNGNGTATLSGPPNSGAGGQYPITVTASNGTAPNVSQSFTLTVAQPPAITSASAAAFAFGIAGSFTVTTTGYPTPALSRSGSLPNGVNFTDNGNGTGTLSGIPTSSGSFPITITASNGSLPNAPQSFTLTVNQAPAITSASSTAFTFGVAGSFTVTTAGYPAPALSRTGSLPNGVNFTDNGNGTGTLSGTPTSGGGQAFSITITASNGSLSNASQQFTLQVLKATPVLSWDPAPIQIGTALVAAQLNATANVLGKFVYTPGFGTKITKPTETLKVAFTPTDSADYNTVSISVPLPVSVVKVSPTSINYGTVKLDSITTKDATVTNLGPDPVSIYNPLLSIVKNGDSREFVAENLCPKSLAPHESCTIKVEFVAGPFYHQQSAKLSVMTSSPGSPETVSLTALTKEP
jgi:subtilase family serine protease